MREDTVKVFESTEGLDELLEERIRACRIGKAKIRLEKDGAPVNGTVCVKQLSHEFDIGANCFMVGEFNDERKEELYFDYFSDCMTLATMPVYWEANEPEMGHYRFSRDSEKLYRRPPLDTCIDFCTAAGVKPKAHCLNYPISYPAWVAKDIPGVKYQLEKRMEILADRYADKVHNWEVVNEILHDNSEHPFYHDEDLVSWSFDTARRYFPENELTINGCGPEIYERYFGRRSPYYMMIERELARGTSIDSVGIQYHLFETERNIHKKTYMLDPLLQIRLLDTYETLGLPLQITEITLSAYGDSPEDDTRQAKLADYLYRLWFGTSAMEAVIYWNLIEGYAAFAPQGDMTQGENIFYGGLIHYDGTPKDAYYVIRDMFKKRYHTEKELTVTGEGELSGFFGSYEVTVKAPGIEKTVTCPLKKDLGENNVWKIKL